MRIAQLSDLHFSKVTLNPLQFFSKRWLGNLNLLFFRHRMFDTKRLHSLIELFTKLKIDLVLICGDLTTTGLKCEYRSAATFVQALREAGIEVLTLPGNHDHYTKRAYKKRLFYRFFKKPSLEKEGVAADPLTNDWTLALLDTALATPLTSSQGYFSPELEKRLDALLSKLPQNQSVILVNHFPFFQCDGARRKLLRGEALEKLLKRYPSVKLYLHGHTHRHTIANLRGDDLPLILDSGSATHHKHGSWNLIDLGKVSCTVSPFLWDQKSGWQKVSARSFDL